MTAKENTLLKAKASVSWIYSNLLGKKANFELLHPTELKHAEEEYAAWTSYLLPIEEALSELENLKQEIIERQETEESLGKELIKVGDELEQLKRDVKRYFSIIKNAMTFDGVVIDEKEQVDFEELQDKLMKVGNEDV